MVKHFSNPFKIRDDHIFAQMTSPGKCCSALCSRTKYVALNYFFVDILCCVYHRE